jgi:hypothetical protein
VRPCDAFGHRLSSDAPDPPEKVLSSSTANANAVVSTSATAKKQTAKKAKGKQGGADETPAAPSGSTPASPAEWYTPPNLLLLGAVDHITHLLPQCAMIACVASVVAADLPDATHVLVETLFRGGYVPRTSLKIPWWGVAPSARAKNDHVAVPPIAASASSSSSSTTAIVTTTAASGSTPALSFTAPFPGVWLQVPFFLCLLMFVIFLLLLLLPFLFPFPPPDTFESESFDCLPVSTQISSATYPALPTPAPEVLSPRRLWWRVVTLLPLKLIQDMRQHALRHHGQSSDGRLLRLLQACPNHAGTPGGAHRGTSPSPERTATAAAVPPTGDAASLPDSEAGCVWCTMVWNSKMLSQLTLCLLIDQRLLGGTAVAATPPPVRAKPADKAEKGVGVGGSTTPSSEEDDPTASIDYLLSDEADKRRPSTTGDSTDAASPSSAGSGSGSSSSTPSSGAATDDGSDSACDGTERWWALRTWLLALRAHALHWCQRQASSVHSHFVRTLAQVRLGRLNEYARLYVPSLHAGCVLHVC